MKKNRIVLSFDDGREDNFEIVRPILFEYGLTASFNIATAYVDGSIEDYEKPCENPSMSKEQVVTLYKDGFEIAGHGDRHKNIEGDIAFGIKKIRAWLDIPTDVPLGFASPNSNLKADDILKKRGFYQNNHISYVRIGIDADSLVKKIERRAAYISGSSKIYDAAFSLSVGKNLDNFIYYSVPVMNKATSEQVINLIKNAMKKGEDCILMFHSILSAGNPYYEDTWTWDKDKFVQLCTWLQNEREAGRLSVMKTMDLVKEGK